MTPVSYISKRGVATSMNRTAAGREEVEHIAGRFVRARLEARALPGFPGTEPTALAAAYACQDAAIALWPEAIQGWKVGRIAEPWLSRLGEDRLVGPVFAQGVQRARPNVITEFPVFDGGFAAVEAEFVVRLGIDPVPAKTTWSASEARDLVAALHVGIETAGSPLATINQLGPLVVISDFGNNAGLILGPEVPHWREFAPEQLASETYVDDERVGSGTAASVAGGPMAALAFALNVCARRGLPMKAGHLVSTGATTGIHDIRIGQSARAVFAGVGEIHCHAVRAQAREARAQSTGVRR
jgi:2-keto-4-pentenoate hydratase